MSVRISILIYSSTVVARRPSLSVHPSTPFKKGYHNDYEKWLLKKLDVTHYLNIKRVWVIHKFGLESERVRSCQVKLNATANLSMSHFWLQKEISPESYQSIYRATRVSMAPSWETGRDFSLNFGRCGWEREDLLTIMSLFTRFRLVCVWADSEACGWQWAITMHLYVWVNMHINAPAGPHACIHLCMHTS